MEIAQTKDIEMRRVRSPGGKFAVDRYDLSGLLGALPDNPPEKGGHPFSVERVSIPPQKQNYPRHSHSSQWEFYLIESGQGELLTDNGKKPLVAGTVCMCEPDEVHALRNTSSEEDLVYLVIANNTTADLVHYPDSRKWLVKPARLCFREPVDYYDGEE